MTRDQVSVALIAGGLSLAVGLLGALVGWRIRRAPIRWSAGLIAAVAVGGVVAGVVGTARAMFLSTHDLGVVVLVCGVSGVVSAAFALLLARTLTLSARRLRVMAAAVGAGELVPPPGSDSREFRAVAEELALSSARLHRSQARERQLEQSRRELVAWVSHDLRTPLAGLRAMAEALDDGLATDPQRYHRQMLKEADRMASMVDDLFELSRIHAGSLALTMETV
ncbi:MAG: histidine kinase dimerization/phospho-acceptor domain-containing protein, partial [Pedococcus sp.]